MPVRIFLNHIDKTILSAGIVDQDCSKTVDKVFQHKFVEIKVRDHVLSTSKTSHIV